MCAVALAQESLGEHPLTPSRRVSFRVSLRWQARQTGANRRKRRQKLEDAKLLQWRAGSVRNSVCEAVLIFAAVAAG
jgi:hypothetical protein